MDNVMDTDVLLYASPMDIVNYLDEQYQADQYKVKKLIIHLNKVQETTENYLNELQTNGEELFQIDLKQATRKFNLYRDQYNNLRIAKTKISSTDIGIDFKTALIDDIIQACYAKLSLAHIEVNDMHFESWLSSKIALNMSILERIQQDLQLLLSEEI